MTWVLHLSPAGHLLSRQTTGCGQVGAHLAGAASLTPLYLEGGFLVTSSLWLAQPSPACLTSIHFFVSTAAPLLQVSVLSCLDSSKTLAGLPASTCPQSSLQEAARVVRRQVTLACTLDCRRDAAPPTAPQRCVHPEPVNVTLAGKKIFADVVKVRCKLVKCPCKRREGKNTEG